MAYKYLVKLAIRAFKGLNQWFSTFSRSCPPWTIKICCAPSPQLHCIVFCFIKQTLKTLKTRKSFWSNNTNWRTRFWQLAHFSERIKAVPCRKLVSAKKSFHARGPRLSALELRKLTEIARPNAHLWPLLRVMTAPFGAFWSGPNYQNSVEDIRAQKRN